MKVIRGSNSKYPESFRIMVAKEYLTSDLSLAELARKHDLKNRDMVRNFVKWYKGKYGSKQSLPSKTLSVKEKQDVKQLKDLLQLKEKELEDAFLKIESLNTIIRVAEKSLNINIGKKSGAKQSRK